MEILLTWNLAVTRWERFVRWIRLRRKGTGGAMEYRSEWGLDAPTRPDSFPPRPPTIPITTTKAI